jgi:hypothetical protein
VDIFSIGSLIQAYNHVLEEVQTQVDEPRFLLKQAFHSSLADALRPAEIDQMHSRNSLHV